MITYKVNVLVIGAGPVGLYAAYLAKEKGLNVLLIEASKTIGGQPLVLYPVKDVHDYPGYTSISAIDLVENFVKQCQHLKVDILTEITLKSYIRNDEHTLKCLLSNGSIVITNNIVIATGNGLFLPNKLEIPGAEENPYIQYLVNSYQPYINKNIVILGGGDSAVDWANNIRTKANANVSIIHRREEFRANGVNVAKLYDNKVNVILNSDSIEIKNKKTLVIKNKTSERVSDINFDYLIVQYGQKVDLNLPSWMNEISLTTTKKIIVNRNNETNIKNIYAIGNIVGYINRPNMIIAGHGEAANAINDIVMKIRDYEALKK